MGQKVPVHLLPARWGSMPQPPNGYFARRSRGVTVARGYPENEPGFKVVRQIAAAAAAPGASWVHSGLTGERTVVYYFDTALYYDEDDATPVSIRTVGLVFCPSFANMGSPAGMSLFCNGTPPVGIRDAGAAALEAFAANLEAPNANWTAAEAAGGSLASLGTFRLRIAQLEVDAVTGTIVSGPSAVKTVTLTGANRRITVAQSTWTPNARATHWRIGITANGGTDAPASYFYSADVAIGTTSVDIDTVPTVTPPFESRNGFYKVADLTEIVSGKHPRGVIVYEGRWIVWYKNDNRILWSERDEWGWYSTNSLDTGAEGGWNLPVRCIVGFRGHLLVFTEAAVHAVFGDFARDLDGAAPTFAAMAIPKTLLPGVGLLGGPEAVKIGSDGRVYFISTSGPAVFSGTLDLLEPEDIRLDWNSLDKSAGNPERWIVVEDPSTGSVWFGMTRKTNASRPLDGASVAGIVDTWWRWLYRRNAWDVPYQLDLTHLAYRTNGTKASFTSDPPLLMGVNHFGTVVQLGFGNAGGDADGVVTSSDFDGILASANTTTTATVALAGIAADGLVGQTVTLRYPSTDAAYPYRFVQKTISDNTATSGGNVTIAWQGAVTAPTASFWTVRIAGRLCDARVAVDPAGFQIPEATPASFYQLHMIEARLRDKVGAEAVS